MKSRTPQRSPSTAVLLAFAIPLASAPALAQTWTPLTSGSTANLGAIHFPTATVGYASGLNNVPGSILKTVDAGATWTPLEMGWSYLGVHFLNADTGWAVGNGGDIRKTTDGGATWINQTNKGGGLTQLNTVRFVNPDVGYAGVQSNQGRVIKTTDGGASWTEQSTGASSGVFDIRTFGPDTVFAATESGIRRSDDGGATWASANSNPVNAIDFPSRQIGYAAGALARILRTTNGGETWSVRFGGLTSPANATTFRAISCPGDSVCYAAGSATSGAWVVYRTLDGGQTWTLNASGTGAGFNGKVGLHFPDSTAGYFVAQGGQIVKSGPVPAAEPTALSSGGAEAFDRNLRLARAADGWRVTARLDAPGAYDLILRDLAGRALWTASGHSADAVVARVIPGAALHPGLHVIELRERNERNGTHGIRVARTAFAATGAR